jgi:RNA polymerase sigma factor (sigma-70 family)
MPSTREISPTTKQRVDALANQLLVEHGAQLLNIARRNSANRDDAEEALQEAFIAFLRKYDPDGEAPVLPWLIVTLKHECWAKRRRRLDLERGHVQAENDELGFLIESIPDHRHTPEERAELEERVSEVHDQLAALKPDHRRAISLKALGYSYEEIGEITGWTHTKINRCMVEGRERLRQLRA